MIGYLVKIFVTALIALVAFILFIDITGRPMPDWFDVVMGVLTKIILPIVMSILLYVLWFKS